MCLNSLPLSRLSDFLARQTKAPPPPKKKKKENTLFKARKPRTSEECHIDLHVDLSVHCLGHHRLFRRRKPEGWGKVWFVSVSRHCGCVACGYILRRSRVYFGNLQVHYEYGVSPSSGRLLLRICTPTFQALCAADITNMVAAVSNGPAAGALT